ncbi:MAG: hypothetical protein JSS63_05380 [Bacteroidetes bacterium]|nr:hypothetical protein [Bacteroidota bacterium]
MKQFLKEYGLIILIVIYTYIDRAFKFNKPMWVDFVLIIIFFGLMMRQIQKGRLSKKQINILSERGEEQKDKLIEEENTNQILIGFYKIVILIIIVFGIYLYFFL